MTRKKNCNTRTSACEEFDVAPARLEPCTKNPRRVEYELVIEERRPEPQTVEVVHSKSGQETFQWIEVQTRFGVKDRDASEPQKGGAA